MFKLFSSTSAKKYPFYGSQFHPEKSIFAWDPSKDINHSFQSIIATQYFGNFFVNEGKFSLFDILFDSN